jgi:hypothetical protein
VGKRGGEAGGGEESARREIWSGRKRLEESGCSLDPNPTADVRMNDWKFSGGPRRRQAQRFLRSFSRLRSLTPPPPSPDLTRAAAKALPPVSTWMSNGSPSTRGRYYCTILRYAYATPHGSHHEFLFFSNLLLHAYLHMGFRGIIQGHIPCCLVAG